MNVCLASVLFLVMGQVCAQPYDPNSKCHSCALDSDHGKCSDAYSPPNHIDVEPGMCDKISELPTEQTRLCKKYDKHPGYYVACANDGMSFSCKASCGVKVEDVGKNFTIDNKLKDIMSNGLLKGLGQDSHQDLLHGSNSFGDDYLGLPNNHAQATQDQNGGRKLNNNNNNNNYNNNNNNNNNNPGFFQNGFDQNYAPQDAFNVYKPLINPQQNQYSNFDFNPLPPPKKTIHNSFATNQPPNYQNPHAPPHNPNQRQYIPPNTPIPHTLPHAGNQPAAPAPSKPYGNVFPNNPNVGYQPVNQPALPQNPNVKPYVPPHTPSPNPTQYVPPHTPIPHTLPHAGNHPAAPAPSKPYGNFFPNNPKVGYQPVNQAALPQNPNVKPYVPPHTPNPNPNQYVPPHTPIPHTLPHAGNHPAAPAPSKPYGNFFPNNPKVGYQPVNQPALPQNPNVKPYIPPHTPIPHTIPHAGNQPAPNAGYQPVNQPHLNGHVPPSHPATAGQPSDLFKAINSIPHPQPVPHSGPDPHTGQAGHAVPRPPHQPPSVPHGPVGPAPHADHGPQTGPVSNGNPQPHVDPVPHVNPVPQTGNYPKQPNGYPTGPQAPNVPNQGPSQQYPANQDGPYNTNAPPSPAQPVQPHPVQPPVIHSNPKPQNSHQPPHQFNDFKNFAPFPHRPGSTDVQNTGNSYSKTSVNPSLPDIQLPNVPNYGINDHPTARKPHENVAAKAIGDPFSSFGGFNANYGFDNGGHFANSQLNHLNNDLGRQVNSVNQATQKQGQGINKVSQTSNNGGYGKSSSSSGSNAGGTSVHFNKGQSSNLLNELDNNGNDHGSSDASNLVKGGTNSHGNHGDAMDKFLNGFQANPVSHEMYNKLGNHKGYFQGFNNIAPQANTGKTPRKSLFNNQFFDFMHG